MPEPQPESNTDSPVETRCGLVAIVGRPNVGKSTLLNHLLEQKISITSRKPQTTRHRILGIRTEENLQTVFVDTPGLHGGHQKAINRLMNATVSNVIDDVDIVLFLVDRTVWNDEDEMVLRALSRVRVPVLLLINKCDLLADKTRLLPHIERVAKKRDFAEIIPLSALGGHNREAVLQAVESRLPPGPFLFPEEQVTDRSSRFIAAELIREKITRQMSAELPYEVNVEIEKFVREEGVIHIHGLILVDKKGQKQIIIGHQGERLKSIGSAARADMEKIFESRVMLNLWVKVRGGWADDERALQSLGYGE